MITIISTEYLNKGTHSISGRALISITANAEQPVLKEVEAWLTDMTDAQAEAHFECWEPRLDHNANQIIFPASAGVQFAVIYYAGVEAWETEQERIEREAIDKVDALFDFSQLEPHNDADLINDDLSWLLSN